MNDFKVHTSIGSWGNGLLTENLNQKVGNKMFLTHVMINCSDLHFIITFWITVQNMEGNYIPFPWMHSFCSRNRADIYQSMQSIWLYWSSKNNITQFILEKKKDPDAKKFDDKDIALFREAFDAFKVSLAWKIFSGNN